MIKAIILIMALIGVIGTLLPGLPGTPVIVIGAFIYGFLEGFHLVSIKFLLILTGLSIVAEVLEYIVSGIGAKKFGGSKYGIIGAIVGGLIGIIFGGPLGVLVGMLSGSIIVELITGKDLIAAGKIGVGALLGALGGSIFSFLIALLMTGLLLSRVF